MLEWSLLGIALLVPLSTKIIGDRGPAMRLRQLAAERPRRSALVLGALTLAACGLVALYLGEPVPSVHDEFSYLLMSNTFASGRLANPALSPQAPFDTFHVILSPTYVSKFFPAQGVALAIGELLTGHPIVGVWLSAALACAATGWMLQAWCGPLSGAVGGILMFVQWGAFSYWTQSYWGGMVAALGGALVLGSIRRLWDRPTSSMAATLGIGIAIGLLSRPVEGTLAALPALSLTSVRVWRRRVSTRDLLREIGLPLAIVTVAATGFIATYNRAATGSVFTVPYLVHEAQYQEAPQFTFLPTRETVRYSSSWIQRFYGGFERRLYDDQQGSRRFETGIPRLVDWWRFFAGILLSAPLAIAALVHSRAAAISQMLLVAGFVVAFHLAPESGLAWSAIRIGLILMEATVLAVVFVDFWSRLALAACALVLLEVFCIKWFHPHYFAPAAPLVVFFQVQALRRLWSARHLTAFDEDPGCSGGEAGAFRIGRPWRSFVVLIPFMVLASVSADVISRATGWWPPQPRRGAAAAFMKAEGWSRSRALIQRELQASPDAHLVFVHYGPRHDVLNEWVFNHADISVARVVWARDLGAEENARVVRQLPGRKIWTIDADSPAPLLIAHGAAQGRQPKVQAGDRLPW